MNTVSFDKAFQEFNSFKVLIVGDVMLDAYAWGKVKRISPEAPVPVLACDKRENRLGGAGNVAKNIRALGAKATICTVIGEDEAGDKLIELFEKNELDSSGVLRTKKRKTTVKTRFLSGFHHLLRVDEEDLELIEIKLEDLLFERVTQQIDSEDYDALIFQDYDKGVLTPNLIQKLKDLCNDRGLFTIVDPKRNNFSEYGGTSLFKPNFKEFCEGAGVELSKDDLPAIIEEAQKYRELNDITYLLITLSEKGILICSNDTVAHIPAQVREIADVSGAGDTVVATATLCLVAGLEADKIASVSNMAGSLVCQHPVVVSVDKEELLEEIKKCY
ncbi:rfaE bifunctional protein kinase chain/domain [Balneicella halophila]|uniref:RfaE bifunctional protein kinase chain/domain n=1 Tax=Balneicella halophila TaxID=1537566 RepID=A0A7L4UNM1_BALHA|nr:PfkB family carbohydrate kinase [Balneicella halophila]PVX50065.1 rfaE bifunctional protein kinase chain/domain [Balneicella halophila]